MRRQERHSSAACRPAAKQICVPSLSPTCVPGVAEDADKASRRQQLAGSFHRRDGTAGLGGGGFVAAGQVAWQREGPNAQMQGSRVEMTTAGAAKRQRTLRQRAGGTPSRTHAYPTPTRHPPPPPQHSPRLNTTSRAGPATTSFMCACEVWCRCSCGASPGATAASTAAAVARSASSCTSNACTVPAGPTALARKAASWPRPAVASTTVSPRRRTCPHALHGWVGAHEWWGHEQWWNHMIINGIGSGVGHEE